MKRIICWSGGKDSTATIILAHQLGIKIDLIITSVVWFDKKRGICGDNPEKIDFMMNKAKPIFEEWGYPVKVVSSEKDYMYWFYKVRKKSIHPEYIGKYYGFLLGGFCKMQGEKVEPIKKFYKQELSEDTVEEIVGICADEPKRLERMKARKNQRSLLAELNLTQENAFEICKKSKLLSPTYTDGQQRDGCWFYPNQKIPEMAKLKQRHPELWRELQKLSKETNVIARGFKYGVPFDEIEKKVDEYIKNPPPQQLSLFDLI